MKTLPETDNYKIPWWRTSLGDIEIENLTQSIQQEYISQGPKTLELEQTIAKTLDVPYVTTVTSGSVALFLALLAAGVGPGDEVLVPNYTFIATAHAVQLTGAQPVFVDTQSDIPVIDCHQLKTKVNSKTKAIIPVHLNGRSVNMQEVAQIAQQFQLTVIEDAAQAIFSKNSAGFLGTQSDIGCFSMGMAKLVASGQGGILVTHSQAIDQRLKQLRTHGHVTIGQTVRSGLNFKYTDLLATIALVQIKRASQRLEHLKAIYSLYEQGLKDNKYLSIIPVNIIKGEVPIYSEFLCKSRSHLIAYLAERGIQSRPFHISLNNEPHLLTDEKFPHSLQWEEQGIILPCGPEQSLENIKEVIELLNRYTPETFD